MCTTLSKMTLGVLLLWATILNSPLVAQNAAVVTEPQLLKVTFDNQLDKPIDIYAVDEQQAEVHYATIPAKAVPVRNRDNRPAPVVAATRELQSYDGTVWRLKLRKSATAQLGDSVTFYDYVTGFAPAQTHTISVEEYYLRRLTPGVEIVLVGDGAVLLADDNPTPRHGPALQGEPRLAVRSMLKGGTNHNYRWIVQSANYLLPVVDDVEEARAEEKINKRKSKGAPGTPQGNRTLEFVGRSNHCVRFKRGKPAVGGLAMDVRMPSQWSVVPCLCSFVKFTSTLKKLPIIELIAARITR